MAKLKSHHQKELFRLEKVSTVDNDELIEKKRTVLAFMNSGKILKKYDVWFKQSKYRPGYQHSYGWRLLHTLGSPDKFLTIKEVYLKSGFKEV